MLKIESITKAFDKQMILKNISLEIPDGSFTVITGSSGSGKTTLLNILSGLEAPDCGRVTADGHRLHSAGEKLKFHRDQAGFLFQNFALVNSQSVAQNLNIAFAYHKPKKKLSAIRQVLHAVDLNGIEQKKIYQLSGGEQQRVALARLLLKNPSYVFADEPTGNLDAANRDAVFSLLKGLNARGKTIIMVTHDHVLAHDDCVTQHIQL